ncbi:hypothetical protein DXG03_006058 [Asterophora parasitica]|uniref:Uncharacterized protein n=1 Tax=Asterophora parasitica TaxID=117018 RepID=A0A9P7FZD4_9AGAR|nr:hypothetical protein DXG03_006058 [Asterophora parasitica]
MDDYRSYRTSLCEILPLVANTHLYVHSVFHRDSIIPILPHIKHLQLNIDITQFKALWQSSGPESFVKLESLNLVIRNGASANAVLLDDHLWGAKHTPFHLAHSLQSLTIECYDRGLRLDVLVPAMDLPETQLSFLDLSDVEGLAATTVLSYIKKCTALNALAITLGADANAGDKHPFHALRGLDFLTIRDSTYNDLDKLRDDYSATLALRAIQAEAWDSLSVLDISHVVFNDASLLYLLLNECTKLTDLTSTVPPLSDAFEGDQVISLPHLKSLHLKNIEHSWLFQLLRTPALSELDIEYKHTQGFDAAAVHHMIMLSMCSILDFQCGWSGRGYPCLPELDDIFIAVPAARSVQIGYIFSGKNLVMKFVQGEILPCVEKLEWPMMEINKELLERRADWELKTYGRLVLKEHPLRAY